MLIQNVNSVVQAPPPVRLASDGGSRVVSGAGTQPGGKAAIDQQPSPQELKSAVDSVNQAMRQAGKSLELSIDPGTKKPVVRMVDSETGELIRQFPSKEVLAIAQGIDQFLKQQGLLLKQEA